VCCRRRSAALHPAPQLVTPAGCCRPDDGAGADIKAVCTESGLLALRERRMRVTQADFRKAKEKVLYKKKEGVPEGLYM
jgi:ATP-dependent 26S proteasome regulatory subunit